MSESIQVSYTRTIEDSFWFRPGETYIVSYGRTNRTIEGRFVGVDGDTLIFRGQDRKKPIYSVRIKSLRRAEMK